MNKRMKKKNKTTIGNIISTSIIEAACAMRRLANSVRQKKMICKDKNCKGYYIKKLWKE